MAPSTDTRGMKYEVFLSFRGADTRLGFTSCLYEYMVDQGIRVFKDDRELGVGEKIEELFKALDDSQIYIPIFSRDFASSAWCLEELARMLDRTSESNGKKIIPIFLDVKTEDVKGSTGLYSNALSELEKVRVKYGDEEEKFKYDPDKVKRWRVAVREVATRFGWEVEGKEQGILIRTIARELLLKLQVKKRALPPNLVERDDEEDIEELLDVHSADHVRFVMIHGAGGIGKTTLASIIFNRFQSKFDSSCFLEVIQCHDLLYMQKKLLSKILGSTSAKEIHDTNDGINRIRRVLSEKKVLLVVDNVDEENQLKNLAGSCDWFGCGSRVIVTGRDISKMKNEDMPRRPSNYSSYLVKEMPFNRAIELFNKHAFGSNTPPIDFPDLSAKVVSSIGGLPLTLEGEGSRFAGMSRSELEKTLEDYNGVPRKDIRKTLSDTLNTSSASVSSHIRRSSRSSSAARPSTPSARATGSRPSSSSVEKTRPSQNSRPSPPGSRPQIVANTSPATARSNSHPSTPTRRNSPPSLSPSAGTPVSSGRVLSNGRSGAAASRPSSPSPRLRLPQQPIVPLDFPLETPPNLRTTLPDRLLSAGRSRPGSAVTVKGNSDTSGPVSATRLQPSPITTRGRVATAQSTGRGQVHAQQKRMASTAY